MENLILLISCLLIGLYGVLNAFTGLSQIGQGKIPVWSASLMLVSGLLIAVSGIMLFGQFSFTLYILIIGLVAIHALTISNGFHLYGKINIRHHLFRFAISIFLFVLAFWNLK